MRPRFVTKAEAVASAGEQAVPFEQFLRAVLEVGQLRAREVEVARRGGAGYDNPIADNYETEAAD